MQDSKPYIDTQDRAVVLLPYLHSQDGPKVFLWGIPRGQNVPGHHGCDLDEFVSRQLRAQADDERAEPLWLLAKGTPVVMLIDDGRPVFDPNHDRFALCRCGHMYYRHFDGYEDNAAVGCKYCDCQVFVAATREKHETFCCPDCRGLLNLDGKTCEVCGKEVEPEPYSVLRHEARVRAAAEREAEAIADDQPRDWETGNEHEGGNEDEEA